MFIRKKEEITSRILQILLLKISATQALRCVNSTMQASGMILPFISQLFIHSSTLLTCFVSLMHLNIHLVCIPPHTQPHAPRTAPHSVYSSQLPESLILSSFSPLSLPPLSLLSLSPLPHYPHTITTLHATCRPTTFYTPITLTAFTNSTREIKKPQ